MFNLKKETHQHTHVSKETAQIQANAQKSIARERNETDLEKAAMQNPETYKMYLQAKKEEDQRYYKSMLILLGVLIGLGVLLFLIFNVF